MHVAKTGLNAQQVRMQIISNNLANVNTNGFKNFLEAKMSPYIHKNGKSKIDKRCKQYISQKKAAGIRKRTKKKK